MKVSEFSKYITKLLFFKGRKTVADKSGGVNRPV